MTDVLASGVAAPLPWTAWIRVAGSPQLPAGSGGGGPQALVAPGVIALTEKSALLLSVSAPSAQRERPIPASVFESAAVVPVPSVEPSVSPS